MHLSITPVFLKAVETTDQDLQFFIKRTVIPLSAAPCRVTRPAYSPSPRKMGGCPQLIFQYNNRRQQGFTMGSGNFKTRYHCGPFGCISLGLEPCAELTGISSESNTTQWRTKELYGLQVVQRQARRSKLFTVFQLQWWWHR